MMDVESLSLTELRRQFEALQAEPVQQGLSESACVDIVLKVAQLKKLHLVTSASGKDFITVERLKKEMCSYLREQGGRVTVAELALALNVSNAVVETKAEEIGRLSNGDVFFVCGEMLSSLYLDELAEEVHALMQETGRVALSELCQTYALPPEFLRQELHARIGRQFFASAGAGRGGQYLEMKTFRERVEAVVRGVFNGATRPVPLSSIAASFNLPADTVESAAAALLSEAHGGDSANIEKKEGGITTPPLASGFLKNGVFIPDSYTAAQAAQIRAFYEANTFVPLSILAANGFKGEAAVSAFLHTHLPGGRLLHAVYVHPRLLAPLQSTAQEAAAAGSWADLGPLIPSCFSAADKRLLLRVACEERLPQHTLPVGTSSSKHPNSTRSSSSTSSGSSNVTDVKRHFSSRSNSDSSSSSSSNTGEISGSGGISSSSRNSGAGDASGGSSLPRLRLLYSTGDDMSKTEESKGAEEEEELLVFSELLLERFCNLMQPYLSWKAAAAAAAATAAPVSAASTAAAGGQKKIHEPISDDTPIIIDTRLQQQVPVRDTTDDGPTTRATASRSGVGGSGRAALLRTKGERKRRERVHTKENALRKLRITLKDVDSACSAHSHIPQSSSSSGSASTQLLLRHFWESLPPPVQRHFWKAHASERINAMFQKYVAAVQEQQASPLQQLRMRGGLEQRQPEQVLQAAFEEVYLCYKGLQVLCLLDGARDHPILIHFFKEKGRPFVEALVHATLVHHNTFEELLIEEAAAAAETDLPAEDVIRRLADSGVPVENLLSCTRCLEERDAVELMRAMHAAAADIHLLLREPDKRRVKQLVASHRSQQKLLFSAVNSCDGAAVVHAALEQLLAQKVANAGATVSIPRDVHALEAAWRLLLEPQTRPRRLPQQQQQAGKNEPVEDERPQQYKRERQHEDREAEEQEDAEGVGAAATTTPTTRSTALPALEDSLDILKSLWHSVIRETETTADNTGRMLYQNDTFSADNL